MAQPLRFPSFLTLPTLGRSSIIVNFGMRTVLRTIFPIKLTAMNAPRPAVATVTHVLFEILAVVMATQVPSDVIANLSKRKGYGL